MSEKAEVKYSIFGHRGAQNMLIDSMIIKGAKPMTIAAKVKAMKNDKTKRTGLSHVKQHAKRLAGLRGNVFDTIKNVATNTENAKALLEKADKLGSDMLAEIAKLEGTAKKAGKKAAAKGTSKGTQAARKAKAEKAKANQVTAK